MGATFEMARPQVRAAEFCERAVLTEENRVIEQYDDETIRCPRVGGEVNFKFCRSENNMLPCRWIIGCWQNKMDINGFLKDHYSTDELDQAFAPRKSKLESLIGLVEKAKKRTTEK